MKTLTKIIPLAVSFFFILLFIYAAASKMLDFENFQVQLAQSPLLSAYAGFVSYGVIILELAIVGLLCFHASRLLGLYASFAIMIAFTVYIFLILNYSDFVPCSCGGILEKMGWTEHLIFNIGCVFMAGVAIILAYHLPVKLSVLDHSEDDYMKNYWHRRRSRRMLVFKMTTLLVLPSGLMVALFLSSEYIMKKENNFTRRFIMHPIMKRKVFTLENNNFYFAGADNSRVYLGNRKLPQTMVSIDHTFQKKSDLIIHLDQKKLRYKSLRLQIKGQYYYLYDGSVPVILRGIIGNADAKIISLGEAYFSQLAVGDSTDFAIRTQSSTSQEFILGYLQAGTHWPLKLHDDILEKQIDGLFDIDGILLTDERAKKFIYVYYYRNQFIVMNNSLEDLKRLKTIDTVMTAKISVTRMSDGRHKMNAPPLKVNRNAFAYKNLLFNQSNQKGKYESRADRKNKSVIDIYRTDEQMYIGSFYFEGEDRNVPSDFIVTDDFFYVLRGNELVQYQLTKSMTKYFE